MFLFSLEVIYHIWMLRYIKKITQCLFMFHYQKFYHVSHGLATSNIYKSKPLTFFFFLFFFLFWLRFLLISPCKLLKSVSQCYFLEKCFCMYKSPLENTNNKEYYNYVTSSFNSKLNFSISFGMSNNLIHLQQN